MTVRVIQGDCIEELAKLPAESVHMCLTSPPYWGLRCYGTDGQLGLEPTLAEHLDKMVEVFAEVHRVLRKDGTLWLNYGDCYAGSWGAQGHRETPAVISRNSIKNHPKLASHTGKIRDAGLKPKDLCMVSNRLAIALQDAGWWVRSEIVWAKPNPMPESVSDRPTQSHEKVWLLTKSARYFYDAEAVREQAAYPDGPNAPDKIKSPHGQGFTRRAPVIAEDRKDLAGPTYSRHRSSINGGQSLQESPDGGRNLRNVWNIATHPYPEAHFATFPPKLAETCIKAGTSEKGVCGDCGAPWVRVVENDLTDIPTQIVQKRAPVSLEATAAYLKECRLAAGLSKSDVDEALGTKTLYSWFEGRPAGIEAPTPDQWTKLKAILALDNRFDAEIYGTIGVEVTQHSPSKARGVRTYEKAWNANRKTTGWSPSCACDAKPVPATVLDCFAGSGTTGLVADRLQRNAILIDLNTKYCEMGVKRIQDDAPLFTEVTP